MKNNDIVRYIYIYIIDIYIYIIDIYIYIYSWIQIMVRIVPNEKNGGIVWYTWIQ